MNISGVERETGLSKDVLRMWERRYGFPQPTRDENDERHYPAEQVSKLRSIKRLMDVGLRPGKLIHRSLAELNGLAKTRLPDRRDVTAPPQETELLRLVLAHDEHALQRELAHALMRQGLQRFIVDTIAPLNRAVGAAWTQGELQIHEEHLYAEQLQVALRAAINAFPRHQSRPRLLLTTFPNEPHGLGLLMVEAMLTPEGAYCISLGPQTPVNDICLAAIAHRADVVALSFSAVFPVRQASDGLNALRRQLPPAVPIWVGGDMTRRLRKISAGVRLVTELTEGIALVRQWRSDQAEAVGTAP